MEISKHLGVNPQPAEINRNKINKSVVNTASFGNNIVVYSDKTNPQIKNANMALKNQALAGISTGYREILKFKTPFHGQGRLYYLDNGQRVIIIPKKGPTTINTFVKTGSFNEPDHLRGISHYIEHNLFNGSKNLAPTEFVKNVNRMGGSYNASTDSCGTNYYITSPIYGNDDLENITKMHFDMLNNPSFLDNMLAKEKDTVVSEIQMYKDNPDYQANDLLIKSLFNINSNGGDLVGGSEKTVRGITKQDVINYYNQHYTPDNMVTVLTGEVNPDEEIKNLSKFANEKRVPIIPKTHKSEVPLFAPIQQTKRTDITSPNINSTLVNMGFVGPQNNSIIENVAIDALMTALIQSKPLKEFSKEFSTSLSIGMQTLSPDFNDPALISLGVNFNPGEEQKGLQSIYSLISNMAQNPISEDNLRLVKNRLKNEFLNASEYSMGITEIAGRAYTNQGDLRAYTDRLKIIDSLSTQDIQNMAKKYLDLNKTAIVVVHPENKASNVAFTGNQVDNKVNFGESNLNIENVKQYDLANNVRIVTNSDPNVIKSAFCIKLKNDYIPQFKTGAAEVLNVMLNDGTSLRTKEQMGEIQDKNDLNLSAIVGPNSINLSFDCPDDKIPLGLELMKEIIYGPSFTEQKFNEAKNRLKLAYSSNPEMPEYRANELLYNNHPYGHTPRKIMEEIDKLTLKDVVDLYQTFLSNPTIAATTTSSSLQNPEYNNMLFSHLTYGIPTCQKFSVKNIPITPNLSTNQVITKSENRNQAHIVQIFPIEKTAKEDIKEESSLMLLNNILGGNSNSRLFSDLREQQQLAYRVSSRYSQGGQTGQIILSIKTSTKDIKDGQVISTPDNIKKSLDGFKKHIDDLIKNSVSNEELNAAKKSLKSDIIFNTESAFDKTSLIHDSLYSSSPIKHTKILLEEIDKLTPQDIKAVAEKYLTKPSVTSIIADKEALDKMNGFLETIGTIVKY